MGPKMRGVCWRKLTYRGHEKGKETQYTVYNVFAEQHIALGITQIPFATASDHPIERVPSVMTQDLSSVMCGRN